MYFIEYLAKKIFGTKKKNVNSNFQNSEELAVKDCDEHVFMPVDSTGEVLSCINCGLVVHKSDLSKSNPF